MMNYQELKKKYNELIPQLINDLASKEITEIFKKRGGDLTAFCYNILFISQYHFNSCLVYDFYNKFKDYIKVVIITEKKNALLERINPLNYKKLVELINRNYEENDFFAGLREFMVKERLTNLLKEMEENAQKTKHVNRN